MKTISATDAPGSTVAIRPAITGLLLGAAMCALPPTFVLAGGNPQVQPISTRYARTATKITVDAEFRYFEDIRLQEVEHFDGIGFDLDVTAPFCKVFQLRLLLPLYTEGDARNILSGRSTHIKGYGGVFDFPSILLEHQLLKQSRHGYNVGWFAGIGEKLEVLETSNGDRLNHQGRIGHLGLKADRGFRDDSVRLLANVACRAYLESDDLNPTGGDDHFFLVDAQAASVFRLHDRAWPGLELKYRGDFEQYNSVSLMPQMIFPVASFLEMKMGVPFRLTHQGERVGARLQLTARF